MEDSFDENNFISSSNNPYCEFNNNNVSSFVRRTYFQHLPIQVSEISSSDDCDENVSDDSTLFNSDAEDNGVQHEDNVERGRWDHNLEREEALSENDDGFEPALPEYDVNHANDGEHYENNAMVEFDDLFDE